MDQVTNFIETLTELVKVLGTTESIVIICICFVVYVYLDHKKHKADKYFFEEFKKLHEKDISRLADDNRRYREIYLKNIGISPEQLTQISAINAKTRGD